MRRPSQSQILLPLLETLQELGGRASADDVIESLTVRLEISPEDRAEQVEYRWDKWGSRRRNPWRQSIHWTRMNAVTRGLIGRNEKGFWTLTDKGDKSLRDCHPGVILRVYETPNGEAVWADAITAAGAIRDGSVDLIYTSPPYPISTGRAYGRFTESDLIGLIMKMAPDMHRGLKDTGSLVLNLKDCYLPSEVTGGHAELSMYIEKLLIALKEEAKFHFSGRHYWRNPSCAPTTPWVTRQKIRAGNDVEHCLWLSKTRAPQADSTQVMEPAKPSTIETYIRKARQGAKGKVCVSGHSNIFEEQVAKAERGENIMVLPRTVQTFSNADPQKKLKLLLEQAGLPAHPAKMPLALAKWWVSFLTKPNDEVRDFFGGSLTTGVAAEELGRRWACSDRSLSYLMGSALRFDPAKVNFEGLLTPLAV